MKLCTGLNPTTLLPTAVDEESHNCLIAINKVCNTKPDLKDTPLAKAVLEFFVEGSASIDHNTGVKRAGYAAALEAEQLPTHFSTQAGELKALTEECKFTKEKITTIYMKWYMTL